MHLWFLVVAALYRSFLCRSPSKYIETIPTSLVFIKSCCRNSIMTGEAEGLYSESPLLLLHPSRIFNQFDVPTSDMKSAQFKSVNIGFNSDTWIISCDRTDEKSDGSEQLVDTLSDSEDEYDHGNETNRKAGDSQQDITVVEEAETVIVDEDDVDSDNPSNMIEKYVLQRINHEVFHQPENIDHNNRLLLTHLDRYHPTIIVPKLFPTRHSNTTVLHDIDTGNYYRLYEYMSHSYSHCIVDSVQRAYELGKTFGSFVYAMSTPVVESRLLIGNMKVTYSDYHNLLLRYQQYTTALANGSIQRLSIAHREIEELYEYIDILHTFKEIAGIDECMEDSDRMIHDPAVTIPAYHRDDRKKLIARVTHHDCKISNMLFNRYDHTGLCVIDLDTTMSGYFLSDLCALYRTSLSPGDEECTDMSLIYIRMDYFEAISQGYLHEMKHVLTEFELQYIVYAGEFMIYMQCLSYLTDFLRGDVYYKVKHSLHNYIRAQNQLKLLKSYRALKNEMQQVIDRILYE